MLIVFLNCFIQVTFRVDQLVGRDDQIIVPVGNGCRIDRYLHIVQELPELI